LLLAASILILEAHRRRLLLAVRPAGHGILTAIRAFSIVT
jgi:hypothetical protein